MPEPFPPREAFPYLADQEYRQLQVLMESHKISQWTGRSRRVREDKKLQEETMNEFSDDLSELSYLMCIAINQARIDHKLPVLAAAWSIQLAARGHAEVMARRNCLEYSGIDDGTPWDRLTRVGYRYANMSEVIACGETDPARVVAGWLADPPHRFAVLGPYREFGGAVARSHGGVLYWCCDFAVPGP